MQASSQHSQILPSLDILSRSQYNPHKLKGGIIIRLVVQLQTFLPGMEKSAQSIPCSISHSFLIPLLYTLNLCQTPGHLLTTAIKVAKATVYRHICEESTNAGSCCLQYQTLADCPYTLWRRVANIHTQAHTQGRFLGVTCNPTFEINEKHWPFISY